MHYKKNAVRLFAGHSKTTGQNVSALRVIGQGGRKAKGTRAAVVPTNISSRGFD